MLGKKPPSPNLGDKLLSLLRLSVSTKQVQQIHAQMLLSAVIKPNFLLSKTVDLGDFAYSSLIFHSIAEPNDYAFNVMIRGLASTWKRYGLVLRLYYRMKLLGLKPNKFTYPFLFIACSVLSELRPARGAHSLVFKIGVDGDGHVGHSLITMYAKCGEPGCARKVFEEITDRDLVSWNSIISGCSKTGRAKDALELFREMLGSGFEPNDVTLIGVLGACGELGDLSMGKWMEEFVVRRKFVMNSYLVSSLIGMYGKCGDLSSARRVFNCTAKTDLVTWNAMISGYAQNALSDEAIVLFKGMIDAGINPDKRTLVVALSACASIGALETGKWIDRYASESKLQHDLYVATALLDMYAKCGSLDDALRVFEDMPQKNEISWNAMISALAFHGRATEAIAIFRRMIREGGDSRPDEITFIGVLSACVHAGLVDEGCSFFNSMSVSYGLTPRIEHYSCIVDLLARAGHVNQAWDLIKKMPEKPDEVLLGSLLAVCQKCKNLEIAGELTRLLLELEPSNSGNYIISSKIYAKLNKLDDSAKMRLLMHKRGVSKTPGCSWIEFGNQLHEFHAGDLSQGGSLELALAFRVLNEDLKREGYVPNLSVV